MRRFIWKSYPWVEQHDLRDCAPACLSSVCRYYGKSIALSRIRELTKTDIDGTSLFGLIEGARSLGFQATALCGTLTELLDGICDR